jgi:hypothetical protein
MKTARREERLADLEHLAAAAPERSRRREEPAGDLAADHPTLSPTIAAAAASAITTAMWSLPEVAATAAVISAVSPGTGTPPASTHTTAKSTG